jgi:formate/nitrite transporter FocA (FNT family)
VASAFPLGLVLVFVAAAQLFTGNRLIVMARINLRMIMGEVLRNWPLVHGAKLLPVTLGHIVGGGGLVGLACWLCCPPGDAPN